MQDSKETLYTSSQIVLFGRVVEDLSVTKSGDAQQDPSKVENFARVYGFTYDGAYYEMLTPVLFLVRGNGEEADDAPVPGPNPRNKKFYEGLRAWTVERTSKTVRLDVDTGKFENLLLETIGDGGGPGGVSGARVSGARVSGARVSGARVSGARVSGARISGARGDASD